MLACCYRSPTPSESSNQNNEKLNRLFRYIEKKNYSHRCIVGGFNFKDINWSTWTTPAMKIVPKPPSLKRLVTPISTNMSRKPPADMGTTIHPYLTLYSLMKQCKSQIFNTTHHWARVTTALFHLNFIAISILLKLKSYAYAKGDYVSMRNELENSNWLRTYTALNEQTSIEDKWLSLKSMLIEQKICTKTVDIRQTILEE